MFSHLAITCTYSHYYTELQNIRKKSSFFASCCCVCAHPCTPHARHSGKVGGPCPMASAPIWHAVSL